MSVGRNGEARPAAGNWTLEMHACTARHDCSIPTYQSAAAGLAVWLGVESVGEATGVWLLSEIGRAHV